MTQHRERNVIGEMTMLVSPKLAEKLGTDGRTKMGDAIWMCSFWSLSENELVNHGSDVKRYFEWAQYLGGSVCPVDLQIKAVLVGRQPDPDTKGRLNYCLRQKLERCLGLHAPAPFSFQARFVWGYPLTVNYVQPDTTPAKTSRTVSPVPHDPWPPDYPH